MVDSDRGFEIRPDGVAKVAGNIGGLLVEAKGVVDALAAAQVPAAAFADIGSSLASMNGKLHNEITSALSRMCAVWQAVNQLTENDAATYRRIDGEVGSAVNRVASTDYVGPRDWGLFRNA